MVLRLGVLGFATGTLMPDATAVAQEPRAPWPDLRPLCRPFSSASVVVGDPDPCGASVVADLSLQKRPEGSKQFVWKKHSHFGQVRDNLGVGRGDLSRQLQKHKHVLGGLRGSQKPKHLMIVML